MPFLVDKHQVNGNTEQEQSKGSESHLIEKEASYSLACSRKGEEKVLKKMVLKYNSHKITASDKHESSSSIVTILAQNLN